jgi:hypothetical protein
MILQNLIGTCDQLGQTNTSAKESQRNQIKSNQIKSYLQGWYEKIVDAPSVMTSTRKGVPQ